MVLHCPHTRTCTHVHFFTHGFALPAHQDLHTCDSGVAVVEAAMPMVVVVVVAAHSLHPVQQSHEHLNDQLSWLCAQKDLHSPNLVLVVVAAGGGVEEDVLGHSIHRHLFS